MRRDKLGIYLNDHLAGATAGGGLARRVADQHRRSARHGDLERVAEQIEQDRRALLDIMDALGVPVRRYKVCAGWAAERLGRFKPNGQVRRRSGLSSVVELEGLRLGVEGKVLLWRTLLAVAEHEERLSAAGLTDLLARARDQADLLETLRVNAAKAVFS
ncbi:hypothetical protein POF50_005390 [Streptomyces sp. SL13]|uniref:Uncharacterized protein n=1 Tax=Streptantibioticus silvisoli TaxID=2705255 RepID=A0AA90H0J4_9ACTN|nr:hypothetical protein [Streptantibioticus silvisoli]MDI5968783.1 hypothetical protein [Streptantibioticus silvisoli]